MNFINPGVQTNNGRIAAYAFVLDKGIPINRIRGAVMIMKQIVFATHFFNDSSPEGGKFAMANLFIKTNGEVSKAFQVCKKIMVDSIRPA